MTKFDWEINIEDLAARVASNYGNDVTESVFARFGASCFEELNPSDYEAVFSDLMLMDSDS